MQHFKENRMRPVPNGIHVFNPLNFPNTYGRRSENTCTPNSTGSNQSTGTGYIYVVGKPETNREQHFNENRMRPVPYDNHIFKPLNFPNTYRRRSENICTSNSTGSNPSTGTGYIFVGRSPVPPGEDHLYNEEQEPPPDYDYDTIQNQSKNCSPKKICKNIIGTVLVLGVLALVAMITINNQKTNSLETRILDGNKERKTLVDGAITMAIKSIKNLSKTLNDESIMDLKNRTETSLRGMKTMLRELFEDYKKNLTIYFSNDNPNSGYSGSQTGGRCYNTTSKGCVEECSTMCDGDYQSCRTCKGYVTCANRQLLHRNCANNNLVWDNIKKRCDSKSDTC